MWLVGSFTSFVFIFDFLNASKDNIRCGGQFWCVPSNEETNSHPTYYHFIPSRGVCEELLPSRYTNCVPAVNCTFVSSKECYNICGKEKKMTGCSATQYGCCGDGVTIRLGEGDCPDEAAPTGGGGRDGGGVGWGVVTSTVGGIAILLGIVAAVSMTIITYRRRQRYKNRWYIHEVLQMYDGGDSSDSGAASDCSWDDPEHKNLFDRL